MSGCDSLAGYHQTNSQFRPGQADRQVNPRGAEWPRFVRLFLKAGVWSIRGSGTCIFLISSNIQWLLPGVQVSPALLPSIPMYFLISLALFLPYGLSLVPFAPECALFLPYVFSLVPLTGHSSCPTDFLSYLSHQTGHSSLPTYFLVAFAPERALFLTYSLSLVSFAPDPSPRCEASEGGDPHLQAYCQGHQEKPPVYKGQ